jgi:hypothetical protein
MVRVAGLEPARAHHPRDFKSLASTISPNPREQDSSTFSACQEPLKKKNAQLIARPNDHRSPIEVMVPRVRLELTTP